MAVESIIDQFNPDIQITRARYAELLIAEQEANCLKNLIHERAQSYGVINREELKLLDQLYNKNEKE